MSPMTLSSLPIRGRGSSTNPANRFERIELEPDLEELDPEAEGPKTEYYRDASRTIIAYNESPDVGFDASINPYRGCEHGCAYCYARPTHEWLGMSAGLDFETKILVKDDAPELLRAELSSSKWVPQVLNISGVTDAYQPIERRLKLTRRCLEVLAEFRNPVGIVTKNELVTLLGGPEPHDRPVLALAASSRHPGVALAVGAAIVPGEMLVVAAVLLALLVESLVSAVYVQRARKALVVETQPDPRAPERSGGWGEGDGPRMPPRTPPDLGTTRREATDH